MKKLLFILLCTAFTLHIEAMDADKESEDGKESISKEFKTLADSYATFIETFKKEIIDNNQVDDDAREGMTQFIQLAGILQQMCETNIKEPNAVYLVRQNKNILMGFCDSTMLAKEFKEKGFFSQSSYDSLCLALAKVTLVFYRTDKLKKLIKPGLYPEMGELFPHDEELKKLLGF